MTDALTIDCPGSIPPPQFSDSIGLVSTAELADLRTFSEQQTRDHVHKSGQATYVEREGIVFYEGIKTSEDVDGDYEGGSQHHECEGYSEGG